MMRIVLCLLVIAAASSGSFAEGPLNVWLDVDPGIGVGDVDDGLMMIQCFHSPELAIRGVSVVFGNAPLDKGVANAHTIVGKFGPKGLPVLAGAASAKDLGKETEAVRGLRQGLMERPMTILAVGPVTNVASLLLLSPTLASRIERLVMVAARRPGQRFMASEKQKVPPHRDANFEHDPEAMKVILDSKIPLVFAPWEVSSHVWINRTDLEALKKSGGSGEWVAKTSAYWITLWETQIDKRGFNPFDTLAAGYLTHPQWIESMDAAVKIVQMQDDRTKTKRDKPYLLAEPYQGVGRKVVYCFRPKKEFKEMLLERLKEPE